jgi:hypothetical protein
MGPGVQSFSRRLCCGRFIGDEWLGAVVEARAVPMMGLAVLPLLRRQLTRAGRPDEFDNLRLVLEVATLAVRAGWQVEVQHATDKATRPDLSLSRGNHRVHVEGCGRDMTESTPADLAIDAGTSGARANDELPPPASTSYSSRCGRRGPVQPASSTEAR